MKHILLWYAMSDSITPQDVGICDDGKRYLLSLDFIKRELKFTAIEGQRNYPSAETNGVISLLSVSTDNDIRTAAKKTLKAMAK